MLGGGGISQFCQSAIPFVSVVDAAIDLLNLKLVLQCWTSYVEFGMRYPIRAWLEFFGYTLE